MVQLAARIRKMERNCQSSSAHDTGMWVVRMNVRHRRIEDGRAQLKLKEVGIVRIERGIEVCFYSRHVDGVVLGSGVIAGNKKGEDGKGKKKPQYSSTKNIHLLTSYLKKTAALRSEGHMLQSAFVEGGREINPWRETGTFLDRWTTGVTKPLSLRRWNAFSSKL